MKGFVFTELFNLVENKFGYKTLQNTIKRSNVPNNGVYVSGGYYTIEELNSLVLALSEETGIPAQELLFLYGRHLFSILIKSYSFFADGKKSPIEFMASVDEYIHVEVRKLHPNAELPSFKIESQTEDSIVLIYESKRGLEAFAKGMMFGCADFYNTVIDVQYTPMDRPNTSRFVVKLIKGAVPEPKSEFEKKATPSFFKRLFG